jgi:hypothetical protein
MANKKISDLPALNAFDFDADSTYILAQQSGQFSPTFISKVGGSSVVAQSSNKLTMFNTERYIANIAAVGENWSRARISYDLKQHGVPSTATAALLDIKQIGEAYPRLMFYYYKNATITGSHLFRYSYDRAMERNPFVWVPVSDGKIYISWVSVNHGNQYTKMYLRGFS